MLEGGDGSGRASEDANKHVQRVMFELREMRWELHLLRSRVREMKRSQSFSAAAAAAAAAAVARRFVALSQYWQREQQSQH